MEPGFSKHKNILFIEDRINAEDIQQLQKHKRAKTVSLTRLKLDNLEFLIPLTNLENLKLYGCTIKDWTALQDLKKMKDLFINGVKKENDNFSFLKQLIHLQELSIGYALHFNSFPDLSNSTNLKRLQLFNCKNLEDIQNVAHIPNLEKFGIVVTPQNPGNLEFIMQLPTIKYMSGAFGGKKIDEEFHALLAKYNIQYG
ncbi:hypothetical protein ACFFLS_04815 [Flavobacterium procerum]|uniref:Leucine-rich repeat domain-containing protein n=1 Tax=Flavobacterium procerum TaxID=1455569 RepID=A0ABV6BN23_9FLAO